MSVGDAGLPPSSGLTIDASGYAAAPGRAGALGAVGSAVGGLGVGAARASGVADGLLSHSLSATIDSSGGKRDSEGRGAPGQRSEARKKRDPIAILRECTIQKKKVRFHDDHLEFEGDEKPDGSGPTMIRFHRSVKCGYRMTEKDVNIDIGSVWYMLRETSVDRSYTSELVKRRGFRYIGVQYRADLSDYLTGRSETCRGLSLLPEVVDADRKRHRNLSPQAGKKKHARGAGSAPGTMTPMSPTVPGVLSEGGNGGGGADTSIVGGSSVLEVESETLVDITFADVMERSRPAKDLDVLVRCPGRMIPNVDLILKIAQDECQLDSKKLRSRKQLEGPALSGSQKVSFAMELEAALKVSQGNRPILLVPCNKNAPVNLLNIQNLLQHGVYKKPENEKLHFFESTRPEFVEVTRNIGGKLWTFEVRDNAKHFTKAQWLRTVAVVADGSDWQFTGWPFESTVDMFTTLRGVYFQNTGVAVPMHVYNWAVKILPLAPVHLDHAFSATRDSFFAEVEGFINSFRVRKFVNHTTLSEKITYIKTPAIL